MPAASAYVGLAPPGDRGSWQFENKVILNKFLMLIFFFSMFIFYKLSLSFGVRAINFGQKQTRMEASGSRM